MTTFGRSTQSTRALMIKLVGIYFYWRFLTKFSSFCLQKKKAQLYIVIEQEHSKVATNYDEENWSGLVDCHIFGGVSSSVRKCNMVEGMMV